MKIQDRAIRAAIPRADRVHTFCSRAARPAAPGDTPGGKFATNHGRFPQHETVEHPANIRMTEAGIGQINRGSQIRRSQSIQQDIGRRLHHLGVAPP
jgi:hypothetical protein